MADERRARQGNWWTIGLVAAIVVLIILLLSRRGREPVGAGEDVDTTADTAVIAPQPLDTADTASEQPADTME
jgi:hypothetical protein